jgi:hypothetical protein
MLAEEGELAFSFSSLCYLGSSSPILFTYWCIVSKSVGFFSIICLKLTHCLSTAASSGVLAE